VELYFYKKYFCENIIPDSSVGTLTLNTAHILQIWIIVFSDCEAMRKSSLQYVNIDANPVCRCKSYLLWVARAKPALARGFL